VVEAVEVVADDFALAVVTTEVLVATLITTFFVNCVGLFLSRAGIYIR
jgi:hypothetical protein